MSTWLEDDDPQPTAHSAAQLRQIIEVLTRERDTAVQQRDTALVEGAALKEANKTLSEYVQHESWQQAQHQEQARVEALPVTERAREAGIAAYEEAIKRGMIKEDAVAIMMSAQQRVRNEAAEAEAAAGKPNAAPTAVTPPPPLPVANPLQPTEPGIQAFQDAIAAGRSKEDAIAAMMNARQGLSYGEGG